MKPANYAISRLTNRVAAGGGSMGARGVINRKQRRLPKRCAKASAPARIPRVSTTLTVKIRTPWLLILISKRCLYLRTDCYTRSAVLCHPPHLNEQCKRNTNDRRGYRGVAHRTYNTSPCSGVRHCKQHPPHLPRSNTGPLWFVWP